VAQTRWKEAQKAKKICGRYDGYIALKGYTEDENEQAKSKGVMVLTRYSTTVAYIYRVVTIG
jgi:hypothetical protein